MRLGNDIVDIAAAAEQHPRFIERILNPEENPYFHEASLWTFWAAKEAAYKAIKQSRDIPFHHRDFIVAADLKSVRFHGEVLHLSSSQDPVFAVVTDGPLADVHSLIHTYEREAPPQEQSRMARALLLQLAVERLQLPREEVAVVADQRIPRLQHRARVLPYPVSLTHHGRFVAASLGLASS